MSKPTTSLTPITSHTHAATRANIPTEELRDFVAADEAAPKTLLYPRDPSLDPQLVWKGKDEQDREPLAVPSAPIYIQETIHPHYLVEDLAAAARSGQPAQMSMFDDLYAGLDFDQRVDFYRHGQQWTNRMILGDSLLVMTSLAEKEGLKGQVQMIYLDPPYGIKFGSNWQVSTRKRDVTDGKAEDATRQPEQVRAFRDTWQLGIHSYLAYLRDRLVVARELLTDSGSIFIQINSENVHLVRCILDEVFGSENFVADIVFRKKSLPLGAKHLETMHDHLLFYAKQIETVKFRHTYEKVGVESVSGHGPYALFPDGTYDHIAVADFQSPLHPHGTNYFSLFALLAPSFSASTVYQYKFHGRVFDAPNQGAWVVSSEKLERLNRADRLQPEGKNLRYRLHYDDFPYRKATNLWVDTQAAFTKTYMVQTATGIVERCLLMTTDPGDLVLDPTCGSGTTAYVAEQWGRRWITIDTSRVALALARTRLMAGRYPFYLLADSPEGQRKQAELSGNLPNLQSPISNPSPASDIRKGFVYKRVPHVTLKAIANNEEIDAIHARFQEQLEPLRAEINRLLGKNWEEWEVPRAWDAQTLRVLETLRVSERVSELHAEWQRLRRERQKEIDASIARRADTETLYDQPYTDAKRVRVSGPFTVESLSPHRVIAPDEERPASQVSGQQAQAGRFEIMILDNLKKAGVQNTYKSERLVFDRLEAYAGEWLQGEGEYLEKDGTPRRVAVAIGPEHGTVGPQLIKEAAKEAVRGVGFDLLIVCGFAFDPHVSEEATRYGKLTVLAARMNPDLAMGEALLKKTGAANLFMVFGEPDIVIHKPTPARSNDFSRSPASEAATANQQVVVEIRGLDVYDPTTGEIRSSRTDDIACWFIDTNYNQETFFVRHAYFTGGDRPYEKLQRALRAGIDEDAWSALYSTTSRPFDLPATGKIAVKVINHYGDEVLKVYDV